MKKIKNLFGIFFLTFLFICTVPTVVETVSWLKEYYFQRYDSTMRKYNTRYYQPAEIINRSVYARQKEVLSQTFPSKEKDYSPAYIWKKICQALLSLPERKNFEEQLVEAFPFRIIFTEISMAFRKTIGMKVPVEYSRHYLRPDGSFGLLPIEENQSFPLERIFNAEKSARKVKAEFHVVVRPNNIPNVYTGNYRGLPDHYTRHLNSRIRQLEKAGISVWDMRKQWEQLPNRSGLFFRTDHHWNVYGALEGARILAAMLNENYRLDYDLKRFDPRYFQKIRFKNIFLGSGGKTLTIEYAEDAKTEDFDILLPAFKTDFSLYTSSKYFNRGDFSVFLFPDKWNYNFYQTNPYAIWLNGDEAEVRIVNHLIPQRKRKKILFIKDSFSISMIPYLALQTGEIYMVDPRERNDAKIQKIIEREKPDFVLWGFSLITLMNWN